MWLYVSVIGLSLLFLFNSIINAQGITQDTWQNLWRFVFRPWFIIYLGVIAPVIFYASQKYIYEKFNKNIWVTTMLQSLLLNLMRILGIWIASKQAPNGKEWIAILIQIALVIFVNIK